MDPGNQDYQQPAQPVQPPNAPPPPTGYMQASQPVPYQQPTPPPQPMQPPAQQPVPQSLPQPQIPQAPQQQFQQPMPTQAPMPQAVPQTPQAPMAPAQMQPQQYVQAEASVQDRMRSAVLKIIGVLSALSLAVVLLLFIVSGSGDSSLVETAEASNAQATYNVPAGWSEDNVGTFAAYYNQETLESSQATLLVVDPVRVSFDEERISDAEIQNLATEYRRTVNDGDSNIRLADGVEVQLEGFYKAFDFEVSGLADDGVTEVRGVSRVLFDNNNYAHTIEFVAIRSYWDANQSDILNIINSYSLQTGE